MAIWVRWVTLRHGPYSKATPSLLVEYLHLRAAEGCGYSVPGSIFNAVRLFETVGGMGQTAITIDPLVKGTAEGLMAQLMSRGGGRGEARRYPVVLCIALELFVVDESGPLYLRFVAGSMLLRVWATLRFDDTKAMPPASANVHEYFWQYDIERTKTTGPGRKRVVVHAYVSKAAYFVKPGWHDTFMEMLRGGPLAYARDYLMPLPSPEWDGLVEVMADSSDILAIERTMIEMLKAPVFTRTARGVTWTSSPRPLLPKGMGDSWSTHSARKVLPSLAGALQAIPPWEVDQLGRWDRGGAADYTQAQAESVQRVQELVSGSLPELGTWYGEDELMADLRKFMLARGILDTDADMTIARFSFKSVGHPFATASSTSASTNTQVQAIANEVPVGGSIQHMSTGAGEVRKVLNVLPNDSGTIAAASSIEASSLADRLWVSVSKKTGFRRLHIIGKRWYTAALREFPSSEDRGTV